MSTQRGVTSVIGTVLLVAITVILASTTSIFMFGVIEDMSRGEPITRFSTEVEDQQYKVVFLGGEEVNPENVVVIFGDTQRKWSDYSQTGSDIEPGIG